MSTHYNTEPPPTASVLLHTTAGDITISLFAQQTPLTCRNFLQHCLDGTYANNLFHRVAPGFVIQTGDSTGTGEGGENIYEDRAFETYDEHWARIMGREAGEKIQFGDEIHSRLKFNRRGLVGMAKSEGKDGGYGTQWFITLADTRAELDGRCTMFGRVEGDGIYNVVKIAEGELLEGTERPVYPEKVLSVEVLQWPKGEAWAAMRPREKVVRSVEEVKKKPVKKAKKGKAVLSFGDDDDGDVVIKPKKAKFNTALIDAPAETLTSNGANKDTPAKKKQPPPPPAPSIPAKRKASDASSRSPEHHRKPSSPDPASQLPLRNPEQPSRSPTEPSRSPSHSPPRRQSNSKSRAALEEEIANLKASMRRPTHQTVGEVSRKQSALEALIPATSIRGRKRGRPGDSASSGHTSKDDSTTLKMLNAFRSRLESADAAASAMNSKGKGKDKDKNKNTYSSDTNGTATGTAPAPQKPNTGGEGDEEDEARLCDLHFIANCQSCFAAEAAEQEAAENSNHNNNDDDDDNDITFLSHSLNFARDTLGKDTEWRKGVRNRALGGDDADGDDGGLVVIDPRAKEKELKGKRDKGKGRAWDRR